MIKRNIYVGLRFRKEIDIAPKVVFKYYCFDTDNIMKILEKNKIPVIKDKMLVRLLEQIPLGMEIPEELYMVIAKIYKVLYKHGYIKEENY